MKQSASWFFSAALRCAATATALWGCSPSQTARDAGNRASASGLPAELKDEYALFTQRCSKCHSLARVLDNGDHDSRYWSRYVSRMRRQPSSGIAPEDVPPILRYLDFYSAQLRAESSDARGGKP